MGDIVNPYDRGCRTFLHQQYCQLVCVFLGLAFFLHFGVRNTSRAFENWRSTCADHQVRHLCRLRKSGMTRSGTIDHPTHTQTLYIYVYICRCRHTQSCIERKTRPSPATLPQAVCTPTESPEHAHPSAYPNRHCE